jgi:putative two-component system response regulator
MGKPMRVLVVDDDVQLCELICDHLGSVGMAARAAFDGDGMRREMARACFDLVILDRMMPGEDGIALCREIRLKLDTPIIMVTAMNESVHVLRGFESGVDDYLGKPFAPSELVARIHSVLRRASADRERETIFRLSKAAEFRDPETGGHLQRMAEYARLIAKHLGLPAEDQRMILEAAPMHDVGKVGTPDDILRKPGKLTPEEIDIMKQHTTMGMQILQGSKSRILQTACVIAHTHHEKFDGSGYPRGLSGEAIPLMGRIVAVADVFDALTSKRPYKPAWSIDRAGDSLREGAGAHFDPHCVDAFFSGWTAALEIHDRQREHVSADLAIAA